jgi:LuxR family transcriptional regulator, maltose regulon positive regulatory protein
LQATYPTRKITCPTLPAALLHRSSILTQFHNACTDTPQPYKLGLVCAPAGYGKTTVLADFAQQTSLPCCWYILDQTDRDQLSFVQTIAASIRECFPSFGIRLDGLIASALRVDTYHGANIPDMETIIDILAEYIESEISERFLLIICNYHEVNNIKPINVLMNRLIKALPASCTLIIESRVVPEIEFALLLAQRKVFGLSSQDFRFAPHEIHELARIQEIDSLSEAEIEQLTLSFDGWIVGILLGTRLGDVSFLRPSEQPGTELHNQALSIDQKRLFSYLVHEVFGREPELFSFLKEAAILQHMEPALCATLLGYPDAVERLSMLEQKGFFVSHTGEQEHLTYFCQPILREILCRELYRENQTRFYALHRHAAVLLYAAHDFEGAVYHAIEAKAFDLTLQFIEELQEQLISQGHAETVARWIDTLPPDTIANNPKLLLIRAAIYTILGNQSQALALLEKASAILSSQPVEADAEPETTLQAAIAVVRSRAFFQTGNYLNAQEVCLKIIASVPADEFAIHAEAHTLLGISANIQGDIATGIVHLQRALYLHGRERIIRQTVDLHSMLASAYSLLGRFALAEHHMSRALASWEAVPDEHGKVLMLIRMGLIKQRQGVYIEAEHSFTKALEMARGDIRFRRGEAYALVNLGELYQEQGRYQQALTTAEDGLSLARQIQDTYLINGALCALAMIYLFMEDTPTALLILSETEKHTEGSIYEKVLLSFTRGTILLYMQQYKEAHALLLSTRDALNLSGLKRDHLQATLRLATCQFALGDEIAGQASLEDIAAQMATLGDYEQILRLELKRLPQLLSLIEVRKNHPALKLLLPWIEEEEEEDGHIASKPPQLDPPSKKLQLTVVENPVRYEIRALGELVVVIDKVPITRWRRAKALEIFFYLLEKDKPVHKEQIINELWLEDNPTDQAFRSTIHCLRKALGEGCIVSQNGSYFLDFAVSFRDNIWYDVTNFQQHHKQAKQFIEQHDEEQAKQSLLAMIDLYRGDYVQSFYNSWCLFRRDELRSAHLDAQNKLAHIFFSQERWEESIHYWQNMLGVDHCLEEAHYGLMRCYLRLGKRGMALRQYQKCVQTLQDELSVAPGIAIHNLYQRLIETNIRRPQ